MKRWNSFDNLFLLDEFYDNIVRCSRIMPGVRGLKKPLHGGMSMVFLLVRIPYILLFRFS